MGDKNKNGVTGFLIHMKLAHFVGQRIDIGKKHKNKNRVTVYLIHI